MELRQTAALVRLSNDHNTVSLSMGTGLRRALVLMAGGERHAKSAGEAVEEGWRVPGVWEMVVVVVVRGVGWGEFWEGRRLTIKLTTLDHFNQFARTPPLPLPSPDYRGGRHPRSTSHDCVTGGPEYPVLI